jgi:hypothetical protein
VLILVSEQPTSSRVVKVTTTVLIDKQVLQEDLPSVFHPAKLRPFDSTQQKTIRELTLKRAVDMHSGQRVETQRMKGVCFTVLETAAGSIRC